MQIGKSSERASDLHRTTQHHGAEPGLGPSAPTPSSVLFPPHRTASPRGSECSLHLVGGHLRDQNAFQHDHWNISLYEIHLGIPYPLGGVIPGTLAGTESWECRGPFTARHRPSLGSCTLPDLSGHGCILPVLFPASAPYCYLA